MHAVVGNCASVCPDGGVTQTTPAIRPVRKFEHESSMLPNYNRDDATDFSALLRHEPVGSVCVLAKETENMSVLL